MSTTETTTLTGTWNVDTVHSIVGFEVGYMVGTFKGRFHDVTAALTVDEDGRAALEGAANVTSVDVQNPDLTAHLRAPTSSTRSASRSSASGRGTSASTASRSRPTARSRSRASRSP